MRTPHQEDPASDAALDREDTVQPGIFCPLSFQQARGIGTSYESAVMTSLESLGSSQVVLLEVGGPKDSMLGREFERVFGKGSVVQLSDWNGGDLHTDAGRKYLERSLEELRPQFVWIYGDSAPYSPLQKWNQKSPDQVQRLQAKREMADLQYEGIAMVFRAASRAGITCVLEMAEHCEAWNHTWWQQLSQELELYTGVCQGCQVNLRDFQGALSCKGWQVASADGALVQTLSLRCDGRHAQSRNRFAHRGVLQYTRELSRRVVKFVERKRAWFQSVVQMQSEGDLCFAASAMTGPEELEPPPEGIQDIPAAERQQIFANLRRIHVATGHCSTQYMKSSLKKRGASKNVMRCLDHFRCDVCAERCRPDPRSQSTLYELAPKWHTLQCDAFSWNHPESKEKWQFILGIDEGSRLRVGRLLFQHQTKTPSAEDFTNYFEGHWLPHFGKPQVLCLDPAGCFRSKSLDGYLMDRQIEVQHIPAEAHWQISVVERAIQTIKGMMTALVGDHPEMSTSEAFYRSLWASNHRDQYRGYSPLQHAFGRAPNELGQLGESHMRDVPILTESGVSAEFGTDAKAMLTAEKAFLEEQAKERLRRAELSGSRTRISVPVTWCLHGAVWFPDKMVTNISRVVSLLVRTGC